MSREVLSQAGTSLADVYDVEGSIAGIERLDIDEIKGVHDLGPQIHSERVLTFMLVATSGNIAQTLPFTAALAGFPDSINRVLSIFVVANTAARVSQASVEITDPASGAGQVLWNWDSVNDIEGGVDVGGFLGQIALRPATPLVGGVPNLITRTGVSGLMPSITLRGQTLTFGAGTVNVRAFIQVARPDRGNPAPGEPSSHGLPIPSW